MSASVVIDWFPVSTTESIRDGRHSRQGHIGFCHEKERHLWAGRATMSTGTGRYFLQGYLHDWLCEVNPNYCRDVCIDKQWLEGVKKGTYSEDDCAFVLTFRKPAMAAMFKLRWYNV